jgi:hypothetical protein
MTHRPNHVMPGLGPGIHALHSRSKQKAWMTGHRPSPVQAPPGMTRWGQYVIRFAAWYYACGRPTGGDIVRQLCLWYQRCAEIAADRIPCEAERTR